MVTQQSLFNLDQLDLWENERRLFSKGFKVVCGVDEAGRGPLAGPVVAGAVSSNKIVDISEINDSKKLSAKKREELYLI